MFRETRVCRTSFHRTLLNEKLKPCIPRPFHTLDGHGSDHRFLFCYCFLHMFNGKEYFPVFMFGLLKPILKLMVFSVDTTMCTGSQEVQTQRKNNKIITRHTIAICLQRALQISFVTVVTSIAYVTILKYFTHSINFFLHDSSLLNSYLLCSGR
jgi:hypothetical protein